MGREVYFMPVTSRRTRRAYDMRAFLKLHVFRKVTIGTTTVTNDVVSFNIPLSSTNRVGGFELTLNNDDGKYTDAFDVTNEVKIYVDYTGTLGSGSLLIGGEIDTIEYVMDRSGALFVVLSGRDYMGTEADRLVFEDFSETPTPASEVVKFLRDKYAPDHDDDNTYIETVDTLIDLSWNGRPLLACIQDVIEQAENKYFFRCDNSKIWHLGKKGNYDSNLTIVFRGNMTFLNNMDKDILSMKNRTWAVGSHPKGVPILHRTDDSSSQTSYHVHETLVEDSNLINLDQVKTKADIENSISSTMEQKGTTGSWGLPTLVPGQDVLIVHPYCKANGKKTVVDVTHSFDSGGFFTDIAYEEAEKTIIDRVVERERVEQERLVTSNIHGLTRTFPLEFKDENYGENGTTPDDDADLESMTRCVVWEDTLMLQLLESDGNCESRVHVADDTVTHILLNVAGSNFESDEGETWFKCEISAQGGGGGTYETVEIGKFFTIPEHLRGKRLKAKFYFTSHTTKLTAVSILYKCMGH